MSQSNFVRPHKPGSLPYESWATLLEFAFLGAVMCLITLVAFHMIGIDLVFE